MARNSAFRTQFKKYVSWPLQGVVAYMAYGFFSMLPIGTASAIGGAIGRTIGPKLGQTKKARRNLTRAFPEKSEGEINQIIHDMWDNLGRCIGEVPHIHDLVIGGPRLEVVGLENGLKLKDDGKPGVFFAGHIGNWEVAMLLARAMDLPMMCVFRAPDNPWTKKLFDRARKGFLGEMVEKGSQGARKLTAFLRKGGHAAMLVDQKMNDGIAVPFFGRDAMTAPALAQFALKYDCPVVPVRLERLEGAHFRLTFYPALEVTQTDDRQADILRIMTDVNSTLEGWIRERPAQWLWLHRRWPD